MKYKEGDVIDVKLRVENATDGCVDCYYSSAHGDCACRYACIYKDHNGMKNDIIFVEVEEV